MKRAHSKWLLLRRFVYELLHEHYSHSHFSFHTPHQIITKENTQNNIQRNIALWHYDIMTVFHIIGYLHRSNMHTHTHTPPPPPCDGYFLTRSVSIDDRDDYFCISTMATRCASWSLSKSAEMLMTTNAKATTTTTAKFDVSTVENKAKLERSNKKQRKSTHTHNGNRDEAAKRASKKRQRRNCKENSLKNY